LTSSATSSLIFEMVSWDSSVPRVWARWWEMSRTVIPPAYNEMIISSSPVGASQTMSTATNVSARSKSFAV